MGREAGSRRAAMLAAGLEEAAGELSALIRRVDPARWSAVPAPGEWAIGKDAAHVAEAVVMHQWIVRRTIGQKVPSRRPPIERKELTTSRSPAETARLIEARAREGAALVRDLTDEELDLTTQPPRARGQRLAETIERVLIGHIHTHREAIVAKMARAAPPVVGREASSP